MKIYTVLGRGKYHPVYGEDFILYDYIDGNMLIAAVMDGCSSGRESFFASALYGKSIRKSLKMLQKTSFVKATPGDAASILTSILQQLFDDLQKTMNLLALDLEEILTTLTLMALDLKQMSAQVIMSGDGLVACNGQVHEIDQQNVPDYMAYHLDLGYEKWLKNHTDHFEFENIRDISISTDGATKIVAMPPTTEKQAAPLRQLLLEGPGEGPNALQAMFDLWANSGEYVIYDDVGIIRVVF